MKVGGNIRTRLVVNPIMFEFEVLLTNNFYPIA